VATNFITGSCTASAIACAPRKSFLVLDGDRSRIVTTGLQLLAQVLRADTGSLFANQARRLCGEPRSDLAAWPRLTSHDRAASIEADDRKRGLAHIDADRGIVAIDLLDRAVLHLTRARSRASFAGGQQHSGTIPLDC
jgi:hypothetical protein